MREKMKDLELKSTAELINLIREQLDRYQSKNGVCGVSYKERFLIEETRADLNKFQARIEELDEQIHALE
ncbi:MAG: hypothetical protein P8I55_02630 [Crocinitomix sp.]|nr:hypothetical protein [Crocinitomix sp.]